jgi:hypothetical protein
MVIFYASYAEQAHIRRMAWVLERRGFEALIEGNDKTLMAIENRLFTPKRQFDSVLVF